MNIEIWSDYMCPFCYIGKRRLETAIQRFGHHEEIAIRFRSFELNPQAEVNSGKSIAEELAAKFGVSVEQAKAMNEQMTANARTAGLTYNMETMVPTNSFDALRLTHWAASLGKMKEMSERLFSAVFTESKSIADHEVLAELASEVGLSREEAKQVLEGDAYAAEVRMDEEEAGKLGITGVPFFVFDRKFAVSGAQPEEVFMQALQKAWEESQPFTVLGADSEATCTDDGCKL
ncbi:disulfide bond formation protein DsbA [Paenibacillus yonginensis]|uniref:Disulfide bond formation protein DsbA n=1 Tax=Paenibacillus yonginensis TaxID=1462996 RepID=A0A1B1MVW6_9BACL|nr:DsbA family oxidoreductase [Paenibacillus yonginensis]ANS73316.1 disulfide bond formation protein DsbA [Paenibacillus yonginensis]